MQKYYEKIRGKEKMDKKYEFTGKTIEVCGRVLHRIKALRNFGFVQAGELGGFIEKEDNLSHEGNAWVFGNAKVYGNARIRENAQVYGNAYINQGGLL